MVNSDDSDGFTLPSDGEDEDMVANSSTVLMGNLRTMVNSAGVTLPGTPELRSPTNFDKTLAVKHEYLGTDFEDVRGRTLHDEGSIIWLPILIELGVILVPGQTLPLTAFYPPTVSMFKDVINKDKTFGVMCVNNIGYGTTAEIYQYQEDADVAGFKIKAKGRQRFKLLDEKRRTPGILFGKVLILPEVTLSKSPCAYRFPSLDKFRNNYSKTKKLTLFNSALAPWPSWVYQQYDIDYLSGKVGWALKGLITEGYNIALPKDPVDLSYWVAQCMLVDGQQRLKMLTFDTAIERLQYASQVLEGGEKLFCHRCGNFVAERADVFSMSTEGPQSMYCNPGGYVHEIITVYNASGLLMVDRPSSEYSWFPGYAWSIMQCSNCDCHIGWLFTAMKDGLKPTQFWGLSKKSVSMNRNNT